MRRHAFPIAIAAIVLVAAVAVVGFGFDPHAVAAGIAIVGAEAVAPATIEDLGRLSKEFKDVGDQLKKFAEDAAKEIKQSGDLTKETKDSVDKLLVKQTELDGRIQEVEKSLARRGGPTDEEHKSVGQIVIGDDKVKSFMADKGRGSVRVAVKQITSASGSAGTLVAPDRRTTIIQPPQRRMVVRDLITPGRTSSNSVEYLKETGYTNNAAVISEGVTKPESNLTFTEVAVPVRTIAHWIRATKQILDDAPMLESYIDGRLRFGLELVEENEILKGPGTGQHLNGIIPQATAFSAAFTPDLPTRIDYVRLAMLQVRLAEFPATGIVMHPTDWAHIELQKSTTGEYVWANPRQLAGPSLWGLPVVDTTAVDAREFLVGAFKLGAQVFDREDANVQVSTEDQDNFVTNRVTIRGEERLALAVYRPEAFVTGDFPDIT